MNPGATFILPQQPLPGDTRGRNAFGYLVGFGKAYKEFHEKKNREANMKTVTKPVPATKPKAIDPDKVFWIEGNLGAIDGQLVERWRENGKTGVRPIGSSIANSRYQLSCYEKELAPWGKLELWRTPRRRTVKRMIYDDKCPDEWIPFSGEGNVVHRVRDTAKKSADKGEALFDPSKYLAK